jgi:pyruvyltransferase
MTVEVVHWNPRRPVVPGRLGRLVPVRRRVNNFGDLIGPVLVERILAARGIDPESGGDPARGADPARGGDPVRSGERRLLTVGSILHLAAPDDVVWGSGINGKEAHLPPDLRLDVRAVRGPITHRLLREAGIEAPRVYGDPALLWSRFWPRESYADGDRRAVGFVPNLHDWVRHRDDPRVIAPQGDLHTIVGQIARCELVVATSLHGIVLAESQVPRLLRGHGARGVPRRGVGRRGDRDGRRPPARLGRRRPPGRVPVRPLGLRVTPRTSR